MNLLTQEPPEGLRVSLHFNRGLSEAQKLAGYSPDARPPICHRSQMRQASRWLAEATRIAEGGFLDEVSQGLPAQLQASAKPFFDRTV
jgi:hypothetical protein